MNPLYSSLELLVKVIICPSEKTKLQSGRQGKSHRAARYRACFIKVRTVFLHPCVVLSFRLIRLRNNLNNSYGIQLLRNNQLPGKKYLYTSVFEVPIPGSTFATKTYNITAYRSLTESELKMCYHFRLFLVFIKLCWYTSTWWDWTSKVYIIECRGEERGGTMQHHLLRKQ